MDAFPGMPIRSCLMHFFKNLGKDIMQDMHTFPGIMNNRKGMKSPLKFLLRSSPDYHQKTLNEIDQGFFSAHRKVEIMAIRKIIATIL